MPPRLRPAADLRRPPARGGGVRRRPAVRGEREELEEGRREVGEGVRLAEIGTQFEAGEQVQCQKVPLEVLRRRLPVYVEGTYWGARTTLAGLVENFHVRSMKDVELEVTPQGTSEESLLKWASGHPGQKVRIHMCGDECTEKLEAEDFVHGVMIRKRSGEDPPWMTNLIDEAPKSGGGSTEVLLRREAGKEGREARKVGRKEQEEEEKERGRARQESGQGKGEDRFEGRCKEGGERSLWKHRSRSRPKVSAEVRCPSPEEGKEEEEELIVRWQHQQPKLFNVRVRGGLRGATESQAFGEESTWSPGCTSHEGNPDFPAHGNRRSVGSRSNGDSTSGDAVLQADVGPKADRRTRARSADALLGDRSRPSRTTGGVCRHASSEIEKCGNGVTGFGMANRPETGGFTSGTPSLIFKSGSQGGNKRTKRRTTHQKRGSEGKREVRAMALARLWRRRSTKGPGLERERKEGQREDRPKEVEAEDMKILSTEEMDLRSFGAPDIGERKEDLQQGPLERHVDGSDSTPTGDGWPSSKVTSLQSKPGETSLMNSPREKFARVRRGREVVPRSGGARDHPGSTAHSFPGLAGKRWGEPETWVSQGQVFLKF